MTQVSMRLLLPVTACLALACVCRGAPTFLSGIQTGSVQNSSVSEASGIIASRMNPNVLWTHNDSGDSARVFAMTSAGANLGTYNISGAGATDWEDIAIGGGPVAGTQYLYIGDIGDNSGSRSSISVYRVAEPVVSDTQSPTTMSVSGAARFTFAYPDGPRDAENMLVDPLTNDIYIISKRENPHHVYRAAYPQSTSGTTTLQLVASFADSAQFTAADISPDGDEIILRSYATNTGRLFARAPGGSIADAFTGTPTTIPLRSEGQGEAIAFDPLGRGYFTTSEGSGQPIYYFDRQVPPPGAYYWDIDGIAAGSRAATGASTGGTGTWNTSAKWYNGVADVPWAAGNDAIFWGTAGTVTLAAPQTVNSLTFKSDGYSLNGSPLSLAGSSVVVVANATATINTAVTGATGLTKSGAGTLRLTTANSYSGLTTIHDGLLLVTNANGSATGTGTVTIDPTGFLGGAGAIQGDALNNGTVTPGTPVGALTIGGNYTQSAIGVLAIDLATTASDKLAVTGSASLAGTLSVSLSGGFSPSVGNVFEVVTASSLGGSTFTLANLPQLSSDLDWYVDYGANAVSLRVTRAGDFDGNGSVDAGDYTVWRKGVGTAYTQADYDSWRTNLGQAPGEAKQAGGAVAEPGLICLLFTFVPIVRRASRKAPIKAPGTAHKLP